MKGVGVDPSIAVNVKEVLDEKSKKEEEDIKEQQTKYKAQQARHK